MWGILSRTTVKMGMQKVRPVSATKLAGRFYAHQEGLPRLPVPALQQTCDRYLAALEPIVEREKLDRTRELVTDFMKAGGVGERLQKSLEKKASAAENWLSDWWLQCAYLDYRLPVVIHSNPGLILPQLEYRNKQDQLRYAAKVISGVLDFKKMVEDEALPVESLGGQPLCMHQYNQLLSSCRVPGLHRDSVVNYAKGSQRPTHIVVIHNGQFFVLQVYSSEDVLLGEDQLITQLERICEASPQPNPKPVGILTSLDRDLWGKAYKEIIADQMNRESLQTIQRSIFILCLDSKSQHAPGETYYNRAAPQLLHGGGSKLNSCNRWFDKTLQFIVGKDGTFGLTYEHAPSEGPPIMALSEHVAEHLKKAAPAHSHYAALMTPRKLLFNIKPTVQGYIEDAKQHLDAMVDNVETKVLVFKHFGKNVPKSYKMSPDAFIQVGFQLAYYRLHQKACSTYESASLRMFRLGRTDTIRSATADSSSFTKAFDDPQTQNTEKVALLERAVRAHRSYTDWAIRGQAIDRHLLGLKLTAAEEQMPVPALFTDPSYEAAMTFKMSTSQVPGKMDCMVIFGPATVDGYGMCYNPRDQHILVSVSSNTACQETDSARMLQAVETALLDMRNLLESTPKAKL